jgi:hypothetical protein
LGLSFNLARAIHENTRNRINENFVLFRGSFSVEPLPKTYSNQIYQPSQRTLFVFSAKRKAQGETDVSDRIHHVAPDDPDVPGKIDLQLNQFTVGNLTARQHKAAGRAEIRNCSAALRY